MEDAALRAARPATGERFDRQVRFAPLGRRGQERLQAARVLLVGCGATGGVLAQTLVRAGLGTLVVVDRDVVETTNLPRQVLFEDRHAEEGAPKALAAAESLARIGGPTRVVPHVAHVDARNLEQLAEDAVLLLDGTDNLPTRYLLNDLAVRDRVPWVYSGVVGGAGLVLPVLPERGPCLRCVFPEPPPPGTLPTCDTAGVVLPAVAAVAAMAAGLALRLVAAEGPSEFPRPRLLELDAWEGSARVLEAEPDPDCPACARRIFPFLDADPGDEPTVLCGRDTVQLPPGDDVGLDLRALERRLQGQSVGLLANDVFVRLRDGALTVTVFRDGRALVEGTADVARARAALDRIVGR